MSSSSLSSTSAPKVPGDPGSADPGQAVHAHANPALAHHFDDLQQQHEAHTLGMWAFLATEIMFFGGLLVAFVVSTTMYPVAFDIAARQLDWQVGTMNTTVLLCSSLSMALAVHFARVANRKMTMLMLLLTVFLGTAFLGVKAYEYSTKWNHHLVPGASYNFEPWQHHPDEAETRLMTRAGVLTANGELNASALPAFQTRTQLFYGYYFTLTGLHAVHMIIGAGVILWLVFRVSKGQCLGDGSNFVEMTGLYWHFVDIVWIYLFPLLYLMDRSS